MRLILSKTLLEVQHLLVGDLAHGRLPLMIGATGNERRHLFLQDRLQFERAASQLRILILDSLQRCHMLGCLRIRNAVR